MHVPSASPSNTSDGEDELSSIPTPPMGSKWGDLPQGAQLQLDQPGNELQTQKAAEEEHVPAGERKRVRSACVACHERKLRCVMLGGGSCEQCVNKSRLCLPRVEKKRGRPRNSVRSAFRGTHALHPRSYSPHNVASHRCATSAGYSSQCVGLMGGGAMQHCTLRQMPTMTAIAMHAYPIGEQPIDGLDAGCQEIDWGTLHGMSGAPTMMAAFPPQLPYNMYQPSSQSQPAPNWASSMPNSMSSVHMAGCIPSSSQRCVVLPNGQMPILSGMPLDLHGDFDLGCPSTNICSEFFSPAHVSDFGQSIGCYCAPHAAPAQARGASSAKSPQAHHSAHYNPPENAPSHARATLPHSTLRRQ
mmetsp:Transcript_7802/g.17227  ORF Transcript_7802/g.17227 Transcript_7802/m.17227 type:complete len:358 (-) Transcript_7802:20-1093(-)